MYNPILTNIGKAKIADAIANNTTVNINTLAVGDSNGTRYSPTESQINLVNERYRTTIDSISIKPESPSLIEMIGVVPSNIGGFTIREVAVFDSDGDMIAISDHPDFEKFIISGSANSLELKFMIAVTNTDVVTLIVDDSAIYATREYVSNLDNGNVKTKGNQTIEDVKTFTSSPIVPTPTTDFQPVPLKSTNITVNVGSGQTYTTINQALEYLSGFYPMYKKSGVTATINLKAGFVMAEQVLVSGIDLGWITIVGEDAETIITHTALTTAFGGAYPVFGVDKGGTSPVIGQLFRFNVEKVGGNKHGLMAFGAGSSAEVLNGKGFIGAGANGLYAVNGSTINADGANCSNAGSNGIVAQNTSAVNADGANCSNAGTNGIFAASTSAVNANGANCSNAGSIGIQAHSSSTINADGANCSNAGTNGIQAHSSSAVNADGANCSNAGTNGIFAANTSAVNANGANCSNAGSIGIVAQNTSTITANSAIIQNQTTGSARITVISGSHISAYSINTTGGTVPVFSQSINTLTGSGIIYQ